MMKMARRGVVLFGVFVVLAKSAGAMDACCGAYMFDWSKGVETREQKTYVTEGWECKPVACEKGATACYQCGDTKVVLWATKKPADGK
jgi:hypothetical protein